MDPKVQFALFFVSFVLAVLATLAVPQHPRFLWLPAAFAVFVFVFVFLGNAFEAM